MLFTFSGRLHVILTAWIVLLHLANGETAEASATTTAVGSLQCDPNTVVTKEKSRTAACSFSLDDEGAGFFAMEEFSFHGMDAGAEPSVYAMTRATLETLEDGSEETVWMGSLPGDNFGLSSLVLGSKGGLTGNFNTAEAAYSVVQFSSGTIQVREMLWKDAKEPSSDIEETLLVERSGIPVTQLSTAMVLETPKIKDTKTVFGNGAGIKGINRKLRDQDRKLQATNNVVLLVIVTNRAMCEYIGLEYGCPYSEANSGPMVNLLKIALTDTNESLRDVGVPVSISIVRYFFVDPPFDERPNRAALDYMEASQQIDEWRDEYEADLVAMIAGEDPVSAGIAFLGGFQSVTDWLYLSLTYTFTHELMHNFGALHNREDSKTSHPYAHGLQVPDATVPFRTVMAYPCPNGVSCPSLPHLSSDSFTFNGVPIGDARHNNARMVTEKAPSVADFRPKPTCFFNFFGLCLCFSGRMTVVTLSKGPTQMDQLEVGDWVLTKDGSYSMVYGFGHRNPQLKTVFLQIHTIDDKELELTADHMLYVFNESTRQATLIPASQVKAGDLLMTTGATSDGTSTRQVKFVHQVTQRGVYAPFTVTGDIVVNGFASSNYIALPVSFQQLVSFDMQHSLQHAAYAPYRLFCGMSLLVGGDSCKVNNGERGGFSEGVWMWLPFLQWLEEHHSQGMFLPIFLYAVAVPVQWTVLVLEQGLLALSMPHIVAALVGYSVWKKQLKKKKMPLAMAQTKADGVPMMKAF